MTKFFITLFLSCSIVSFSQNKEQKTILEDTQKMIGYFETKNYDGFLDYTYPEVFNIVSRDALKQALELTLNGSDEMKFEMLDTDVSTFQVSDIFSNESKEYAFLVYPMKMKMTFLKEEFDTEAKEMMIDMMAMKGFEAHFLNSNTMQIEKFSLIIGIKDELTNDAWKYLNYDESPLFSQVLSEEIITQAKDYLEKQTQKQ